MKELFSLSELPVARNYADAGVDAGNVTFVLPRDDVHETGAVAALQSVHSDILDWSRRSLSDTGMRNMMRIKAIRVVRRYWVNVMYVLYHARRQQAMM
jgi:hypothetical protein